MPGPYSNPKGVVIVGGGGTPKKKGFPKRMKPMPLPGKGSVQLPDKKPMPRPKPLPKPGRSNAQGDKKPGNTYYLYDKNYNKGWLPGGADNPITTYAKGIIAITTGIVIPNMKSWEDRNRSNNNTKLNP